MQQQARALGDPTRHRVFRYVADAAGPVDVAELTEHFGLNHNAIRQHLAKLVDAGLVVEETAPSSGRGRPRLVYRLDPATDSRWGVTGPYERLSLWLAEMVRTGDTPVEVGRRAGRRQRLGANGPATMIRCRAWSTRWPDTASIPPCASAATSVDITLRTCPFESTALADPDTVCELHLGMAYGIAESLDGLEVDELVPKDPRRGRLPTPMPSGTRLVTVTGPVVPSGRDRPRPRHPSRHP